MEKKEEQSESLVVVRKRHRSSTPSKRPPPELFDEDFYRARYGDRLASDKDPLEDYLENGWKLGWDPGPKFSTSYYLERNKDVAEAGFNPLVHYVLYGKEEGRRPAPFFSSLKDYTYKPSLSIIIPVYNHAAFLPQRMNSIFAQKYENIELIILDDASTDGSVQVIERMLCDKNIPHQIVRNFVNSGAIFEQWEKGLRLAKGELIWICESDDYCDERFLKELVPLFADQSIMLAFGDIQFCDEESRPIEGLDHYRTAAETGIWNETLVRPAAEWFEKAFSSANVIPNVGGCIFRNQSLSDEEWSALRNYSIVGDWYFYLIVSRGGRIGYEPAARAYFRQHNTNSSVKSFRSEKYYREHENIAKAIAERWGLSKENIGKIEKNVRHQYDRFYFNSQTAFEELLDSENIRSTPRRELHILLCILGFQLGGGEIFPIHLANMLVKTGVNVSMLIMQSAKEDQGVRAKLDTRVAVYDFGILEELGIERFVSALRVDIVHSHNVAADIHFFKEKNADFNIPYVVTLHGSYEFVTFSDEIRYKLLKGVKRWVYLTKRNLGHLSEIPLDPRILIKLPNAIEVVREELAFTRADLGISDDAIVFAVVSRAIKAKSWEQAAIAFEQAMQKSNREMHLLFCGTGPEMDRLLPIYSSDNIHFLDFQSNPHGIYAMSDCALLPSRFGGESYPLTLIESLQVGRRAICTDLGECRSMMTTSEGEAGIVISSLPDDGEFVDALIDSILTMSESKNYSIFKKRAESLSTAFDPVNMLEAYMAIYKEILKEAADLRPTFVN